MESSLTNIYYCHGCKTSKALSEFMGYGDSKYTPLRITFASYRNSINKHLSKELANKIIELIEDADGYKWNYNHLYTSKNNITYWYFCSQRDIKASKSHKHSDPFK
ncbi:unnamed protein product [Rhizophagus irregularis]|nr:unnamed protein product [Rhizophagus irregularis]